MENTHILTIIVGVSSFHVWITLHKLGNDIRVFKNKISFLRSEEEFFKNTFLVKFLGQKRKECIIIVSSIWAVYAISLILILSKTFPMEIIPYNVETRHIFPFVLSYFIFLLNCIYFHFDKMPTYESVFESKNINQFLKRMDVKDLNELEKLYKEYEEKGSEKDKKELFDKLP